MKKGSHHSDATRQALSDARRGKPQNFSEEARAAMSAATKGIKRGPMPAAQKAKLAAANLGKPLPEATKAAMREAWVRRKAEGRGTVSPETKAKMSAAAIGKPKSDEARAAMSAARKGKPGHAWSDAEKAAMSSRMAGTTPSQKTRDASRKAKLGKPGYWTGKTRGELSEEWRDAISKGNQGKKLSPEHIASMSGTNSHFWGKPPAHGKRIEYNGTVFRSTYEVRFAKAIDARGIKWEYEPFRFDLGTCTYRPDFRLEDKDGFWEVKGWMGPDSIRKIALFRECYPEIPLYVATKPILELLERLTAEHFAAPQTVDLHPAA